jgi:hypothetical protein
VKGCPPELQGGLCEMLKTTKGAHREQRANIARNDGQYEGNIKNENEIDAA